jgi:hypothetical protein
MDDFAEQHTEPLRKALRRGGCQIDGDGHITLPPVRLSRISLDGLRDPAAILDSFDRIQTASTPAGCGSAGRQPATQGRVTDAGPSHCERTVQPAATVRTAWTASIAPWLCLATARPERLVPTTHRPHRRKHRFRHVSLPAATIRAPRFTREIPHLYAILRRPSRRSHHRDRDQGGVAGSRVLMRTARCSSHDRC